MSIFLEKYNILAIYNSCKLTKPIKVEYYEKYDRTDERSNFTIILGASGDVMFGKLDQQTFMREPESH